MLRTIFSVRGIAGVLALMGVIIISGCASDSSVISQANEMNDALQPAIITDPVLSQYIQKVGDRIIDAAGEMYRQGYGPAAQVDEDSQWMFSQKMQFHFVNSKTLNAFTTGGEHMYVYTELFQKTHNENELATVMAHEFAHVYGRHVQKGMNRQYGVLLATVGAGAAGYALGDKSNRETYAGLAAGGAMLAGQLINAGFTREDEAEADKMGFEFYIRAGYDPDHFGDFFQRMIDLGLDKGSDGVGKYLSDHPSLKSRVELAHKRAAELSPQVKQQMERPDVASAAQYAQLQQRSIQVGASMPNDTTLSAVSELLQALPRSCLTPVIFPDQERAAEELEERARQQEQLQNGQQRQQELNRQQQEKKKEKSAKSAPQQAGQISQSPPSYRSGQ